jgi:ribose transport system permease protein
MDTSTNKLKVREGNSLRKFVSSYIFVIIFVVLCIVYFWSSTALTWDGAMNILRHSGVIGIISLGMALVILAGQIDLSVGSMMALVGSMSVVIFNATGSVLATLLFALAFGAFCGFINGILIGAVQMPAFIVTLATMLIFRSLAQYSCHAFPVALTGGTNSLFKLSRDYATYEGLFNFGNAKVLTIPMAGLFLIIITALLVYLSTSTKYGKKVYAIGSNERAAKLAGINVEWVRVSVFVLAGVLVGIGAFFQVAMNGSIDPANSGNSFEMYAIAAVVLGGISMSGGKGRCIGVLFGAMSYTVIDKIITALNVDSLINNAVKGTILLLAVFIQIMGPVLREKMRRRKAC